MATRVFQLALGQLTRPATWIALPLGRIPRVAYLQPYVEFRILWARFACLDKRYISHLLQLEHDVRANEIESDYSTTFENDWAGGSRQGVRPSLTGGT